MMDLTEKIKAMSLTKTEKQIADYILDHIDTLGLKTITALAAEIGVSDTSIIRFLRALGFAGYSDFKREMGARMMTQYIDGALSPGQKYRKRKNTLRKENLVNDVLSCTVENLHKSAQTLDMATVEQVADTLIRSKRKFIAAFRGTSCCTAYMYRKLILLLPDVICCDQAESRAIEQMVDISPEDCLMLYSFPHYSEINFSLLDIARRNGAQIIVITDRVTSPLASSANYLLTAAVEGLGFTNSYAAPLFLSEVILLAISERNDAAHAQRIALIDEYIGKHQMY